MVEIKPERRIWRDLDIAVTAEADPEAREFIGFLQSPEAQEIMKSEGWVR